MQDTDCEQGCSVGVNILKGKEEQLNVLLLFTIQIGERVSFGPNSSSLVLKISAWGRKVWSTHPIDDMSSYSLPTICCHPDLLASRISFVKYHRALVLTVCDSQGMTVNSFRTFESYLSSISGSGL